jgi:hypothetical protein
VIIQIPGNNLKELAYFSFLVYYLPTLNLSLDLFSFFVFSAFIF